MYESEEEHLVEPSPERGQTGNILLDSDVDIKKVLTLPTPPSSKRRVVANFGELAGAQINKTFGNIYDGSLAPNLIPTPSHPRFMLLSGATGGDVIVSTYPRTVLPVSRSPCGTGATL